MNETLKVLSSRFSCRDYKNIMPSDEQINAITSAAIKSPSSRNRQRWQVIVVKNKALMSEIETEALNALAKSDDQAMYESMMAKGGKIFYNAPCVIFIPIDVKDKVSSALDCGIVTQSIAIAASSVGLASCIIGLAKLAFTKEKANYFKERLSFPDGYEFGMAVIIGEPASKPVPRQANPDKVTIIK